MGVLKRRRGAPRAQLCRLAEIRDTELRRKALREFAESALVFGLRSDMVAGHVIRTGTTPSTDRTTLSCVFVREATGDDGDRAVPVFCEAALPSPLPQSLLPDAFDALVVCRMHNNLLLTKKANNDGAQRARLGSSALGDLRVCWPRGQRRLCLLDPNTGRTFLTRATAADLAASLPLPAAGESNQQPQQPRLKLLQACVSELGPSGGEDAEDERWQSELRERLRRDTRDARETSAALRELRHALLAPGANTCFAEYDAEYAEALRYMHNLGTVAPAPAPAPAAAGAEQERFAAALFEETKALYVRSIAHELPSGNEGEGGAAFADAPTFEDKLRVARTDESVPGGAGAVVSAAPVATGASASGGAARLLRWYMRTHARLQRRFQSVL